MSMSGVIGVGYLFVDWGLTGRGLRFGVEYCLIFSCLCLLLI